MWPASLLQCAFLKGPEKDEQGGKPVSPDDHGDKPPCAAPVMAGEPVRPCMPVNALPPGGVGEDEGEREVVACEACLDRGGSVMPRVRVLVP